MTEQEATELIATKLMGFESSSSDLSWVVWKEDKTLKWGCGKDTWNPFHDSNHARMVKDKIGYTAPHIYAPRLAKRLNLPPKVEDWTWVDAFSYHNAPDDVCMWSVVDILKEMEK